MTVSPGFFGGKYKNRPKQPAERVEDRVHRALRRAAARGIGRVAVETVFGNVHIETAQIDGAELIERVVNLVKLVSGISRATLVDHSLESVHNPAIHEREFLFPGFLAS